MEAKLKELLAEVEALEKISAKEKEEYRLDSQWKCYKEGFAAGARAMCDEIGAKLKQIIQ